MDRKLVAGAVLLLIVQIALLFFDMSRGSRLFESVDSVNSDLSQIGKISWTENSVRRRTRHSLIWDESRPSDKVYEFDSILTLKGSSARVDLGDGGQLNLDENTLIVLEPSRESDDGTLKIRFTKGTLRSDNPTDRLNLIGESLDIQIEKGSSVSVVSLADGEFSVEVEKGEAVLQTEAGRESVKSGEKARIQNSRLESKKEISDQFEWSSGIPRRIYSHAFPVQLDLKWRGHTRRLRTIHPDKSQTVTELPETASNQTPIQLEAGTYLFELESDDRISETLTLQVRKSPQFSYFSPLPRDRVRVRDVVDFAWQAVPQAMSYRLEISHSPTFGDTLSHVSTEQPRARLQIQAQGQLFWRVISLDDLGVEMLPLRIYPLFSAPAPLEAPKLMNSPEIRLPSSQPKPSREGARIFEVFVNRAFAQAPNSPLLEAVFSWSEVPGADHYTIEISATPGFETPLVNAKTDRNEFVWSGVQPGRYFWRVAAGRNASEDAPEEVGYFSSPSLADLSSPENAAGAGVQIRELPTETPIVTTTDGLEKKQSSKRSAPGLKSKKSIPLKSLMPEPSPSPTPIATSDSQPDETPNASSSSSVPSSDDPQPSQEGTVSAVASNNGPFRVLVGWEPVWRSMKTESSESISGSFVGIAPLGLSIDATVTDSHHGSLQAYLKFSTETWKPRTQSKTPLQSELQSQQWQSDVTYLKHGRSWSYGLGFGSKPNFIRSSEEAGAFESITLMGPSIRFHAGSDGYRLSALLHLALSDTFYGVRSTGYWAVTWKLSEPLGFFLGPSASLLYLKGPENTSLLDLEIGIKTGLSW